MLRNKRKKIFFLLLSIIVIINMSKTYAFGFELKPKRVYMVILNRTTLHDLLTMESLKQLIDSGALGLMTTRGGSSYDNADGYITINTSSRANATYSTAISYELDDDNNYKSIYERKSGYDADNYRIANPEIIKLANQNKGNDYPVHLGALGDSLNSRGYETAVFGNSDTADELIRTNCLIAMNSHGLINNGVIEEITIHDDTYPSSLRTDYKKIKKEIEKLSLDTTLVVIEAGDLNRLYLERDSMSDSVFQLHKESILKDIDAFIKELMIYHQENMRLFILSPNKGYDRDNKVDGKLTPIVVWGDGVHEGILTSGTTRRMGIVSNIDIAPSISDYLQTSSENFTGRKIRVIEQDDSLSHIRLLYERLGFISNIRYTILSLYSMVTMTILGIVFLLSLVNLHNRPRIASIMKKMIMVLLVIPLALLLVSVIPITNGMHYILSVLGVFLAVLFIIYRIGDENRMFFIMGVTSLVILLDIIWGGYLIKYSTLGYDPAIGARYFGIGNELTGVFMAALILFVAHIFQYARKPYAFLMLPIMGIFVMVYPNLGANVGGTLSVTFAVFYFVFKVFDINIGFRRLLQLVFVIGFIMITIGLLDAIVSSSPSHLGNTILQLSHEGPSYIWKILVRKVQMNVRLIGITIWAKVLFVTILIALLTVLIKRETLKKAAKDKKYIFFGIISSLVGSMTGFLINDSGVLLAALSNIYITSILLYATIGYEVKQWSRK